MATQCLKAFGGFFKKSRFPTTVKGSQQQPKMSEHAQQEASSPVLYHASMSKESFQSKLDDKSSSASSDSKKTKSSATGITSILSEQYSTTLISLLFKKPVPQWLLWMFHVHIIYGSLSVAFEKGRFRKIMFYIHYDISPI